MTTQTKADRSAAGKKAAATRERNEQKAENKEQGRRAAASRLTNEARDGIDKARTEAGKAASSALNVGKATTGAAISAGRGLAARVGLGGKK